MKEQLSIQQDMATLKKPSLPIPKKVPVSFLRVSKEKQANMKQNQPQ